MAYCSSGKIWGFLTLDLTFCAVVVDYPFLRMHALPPGYICAKCIYIPVLVFNNTQIRVEEEVEQGAFLSYYSF